MTAASQGFLVVVLIGAALAKLADHDQFLRSLSSIPWLKLRWARVASRGIPAAELLLAALLVLTPRLGGAATAALLVTFASVVGVELTAGRTFRCSCFGGVDPSPAAWTIILRNAVLVGPAAALAVIDASSSLPAALVGCAAGLVLLLAEVGTSTLRLVRAA